MDRTTPSKKVAGLTCWKCGLSRSTLRKWFTLYDEEGETGLCGQSRQPCNSPAVVVHEQQETWILEVHKKRKLRVSCIQYEIKKQHSFHRSLAKIQKILKELNLSVLCRIRRKQEPKCYSTSLPGESIQMDTIIIGPRNYQ